MSPAWCTASGASSRPFPQCPLALLPCTGNVFLPPNSAARWGLAVPSLQPTLYLQPVASKPDLLLPSLLSSRSTCQPLLRSPSAHPTTLRAPQTQDRPYLVPAHTGPPGLPCRRRVAQTLPVSLHQCPPMAKRVQSLQPGIHLSITASFSPSQLPTRSLWLLTSAAQPPNSHLLLPLH